MQNQRLNKSDTKLSNATKSQKIQQSPDLMMQLQRQLGNQAVIQLMRDVTLSPETLTHLQNTQGNQAIQNMLGHTPVETPKIQRKIDEDKVAEFKELLDLSSVTIVEVPNNTSITLDTKFGDYPDGSTYNAGAISGMSLLDVNYGAGADDMRTDPESAEFLGSKAYDIVDMSGGGGYMHTHNMVMYNEGITDVNRAILHEMGHAKQNEGGANFATANQIILEYHNVLINENRFTDLEEGEDAELRLKYLDASSTSKNNKKTWDDFVAHATAETNPQKDQNKRLIDELLATITGLPKYKGLGDQVKENLKNEYYNRL